MPNATLTAAEGVGTASIPDRGLRGAARALYLYENKSASVVLLGRSLYLYENKSASVTLAARGLYLYENKSASVELLARSLYLYENKSVWAVAPAARAHYLYAATTDGEVFPWLMDISPHEQVRGGQVDLYGDGFGSVVDVAAGATITAISTNGLNVPAQAVDRSDATEWVSNDTAAWIRFTFASPQTITMIGLVDRAAGSSWGTPLFRFDAGADVIGSGAVQPPVASPGAEYPAGAGRTVYTLATPRTSSFLEIRVSSGGSGSNRGFAEVWIWADQDVAAEDSKAFLRTDEMGVAAWVNRSPGLYPANSGLPIQPAATVTVPATGESGLVKVVENT